VFVTGRNFAPHTRNDRQLPANWTGEALRLV
jgi:hypothetical protein